MQTFYLVQGETRIPVGTSAPAYDHDLRAWNTGDGLVSAESLDTFSVVAEDQQPSATYRLLVSPVEFKMLFSPTERLAIRQAREYTGDDAALKTAALLIDDWWSIVDDPRLTAVNLALPQTQQGLDMLVDAEILTQERRDEIGLGLPE